MSSVVMHAAAQDPLFSDPRTCMPHGTVISELKARAAV